jgi:glyoxylase I family protein
MTTAGISGFSHVNLVVHDLEAAREFYEDKLGLQQLRRPDFGMPDKLTGYWFKLGPSQLHLSGVDTAPDFHGGAPHMALYVPTEVFDDTIHALEAKGVTFTMGIRQRDDFGVPVKTAFAKDPSGNLIEFTDVALFAA